jgi:hypothetical protein
MGAKRKEKVFYITCKKDGRTIETKASRQYSGDMAAARAARLRGELIEGKAQTRKEEREAAAAAKKADGERWTIDRLWQEYKTRQPFTRSLKVDDNRYQNHLIGPFGGKKPCESIQKSSKNGKSFCIPRAKRQSKKNSP